MPDSTDVLSMNVRTLFGLHEKIRMPRVEILNGGIEYIFAFHGLRRFLRWFLITLPRLSFSFLRFQRKSTRNNGSSIAATAGAAAAAAARPAELR